MNDKNKLTGMLIGLARATYGNEDIITPDTYPVIVRRLCAGDDKTADMVKAVEAEKYRIVPDCAVCTVKCGRNEDFDMALLDTELPYIKDIKLQLLATARRLAQCVNDGGNSDVNMYIVKALMMTGTLNLPAELLTPVVTEGEKLLEKYR